MSPPKHYLPGTGKAPAEKSRFAQTCNRLSLFLKEKGSIRDLSFEISAKYGPKGVLETSPAEATTLDLLSNIDDRGEKAFQGEKSLKEPDNLPQYVILDSSSELDDATNKASSSKPIITKPKTAQMTIFYGGEILVLDDVPADRARELMLVAKNGLPTENPIQVASPSGPEEPIRAEVQAKDSDLPIARRASLHKFLAKRKDRATVRAPYQVHNQSLGGSSSGNEHSFDLNL